MKAWCGKTHLRKSPLDARDLPIRARPTGDVRKIPVSRFELTQRKNSSPQLVTLDQFGDDSMPAGITSTACFEQEPSAPLGFVDPDFDQARTGDVSVLLADAVGFA